MREMDFVDEYYADKDLSLLKKLTLVIPTYNRNYYLSRCLWYHSHFPFGEIIVADSSPEEKKVVNRETVQKIREMFGAKIRYLEYEPETEKYGGDIYRKWGDAVQHVGTEYSQIVTDKEFLIPTVVNTSIEWLEKSIDYTSASAVRQSLLMIRGKYFLKKWTKNNTSFENEDPLERLKNYNQRMCPDELLLTIKRTTDHNKYYENLKKYAIQDIRFGEVALELQPIADGKIKRIDGKTIKIRDETRLFGNISWNKSESSSIRYPTMREFPKEYRLRTINSLSKCICEEYMFEKTEDRCRDVLKKIVGWWFCNQIPLYRKIVYHPRADRLKSYLLGQIKSIHYYKFQDIEKEKDTKIIIKLCQYLDQQVEEDVPINDLITQTPFKKIQLFD